MKKTLTVADDHRIITTTNGAETTTEAFYLRELKDFTPLPNGFNLALANEIIDFVESTSGALWYQGSWREILGRWMDEDKAEAVAKLNPTLVTSEAERCGTTMCIAGWAAELTGVDWFVDAEMAKAGLTAFDHMVIVRRDDPAATDSGMTDDSPLHLGLDSTHSEAYAKAMARRGFSPETHTTVEASTYAAYALGIPEAYDTLNLFGAGNTWWKVRGIIDAYAHFGPVGELSMSRNLELCVMVNGVDDAVGEWEHDDEEAERWGEDLRARKVGFDYRLATAPQWAKNKVGAA